MDKISQKGDPLEKLNEIVPWEKLFLTPVSRAFAKTHKGPGGRPRYDYVLMMKILVLQRAYNISDDDMEYQLLDRFSFRRFLGLNIVDDIPDATTIWLFRETLIKVGMVEKLFKRFNDFLEEHGVLMKTGSIVDASFVDVPRQRNTRDENKMIKEGKVPDDWNDAKREQKDTDARWMEKNGEKHFGYKNHIKADAGSKIITRYAVTTANVHDSQAFDQLLEKSDKGKPMHGDSAYKSAAIERKLMRRKIIGKIHEKGYRNTPLTNKQLSANQKKSKVRARIEHIFGFIENSMDGGMIRSIGSLRAKGLIGLMNLTYNLFRFMQLSRV
jgi:IS5 family transposase